MNIEVLKEKVARLILKISAKKKRCNIRCAEGALREAEYSDLYTAVVHAKYAAAEEYANYGSIDRPKKFAPGEITDGKTCLDSDCCTATQNLLNAENALKEYYETTVVPILNKKVTNFLKIGFLGGSLVDVLAQYDIVLEKLADLNNYITQDDLIEDNIDKKVLKRKIEEVNAEIRKLFYIDDDLVEPGDNVVQPLANEVAESQRTFKEKHNQIIELAEAMYAHHIECHRNQYTIEFKEFDATDLNKTEERKIFAGGFTMAQCGQQLPTTKNNNDFTFIKWLAGLTDFTTDTIVNGDLEVKGKWNIKVQCEWKIDGEHVADRPTQQIASGESCRTWLEQELTAYSGQYESTVNVPSISDFSNLVISVNNYKFVIDGTTKTALVRVMVRDKEINGWGDWYEWEEFRQTVKLGDDYDLKKYGSYDRSFLSKIFENGEDHIFDTSFKYSKSEDCPSYKNITQNTDLKMDCYQLFRVEYFDENETSITCYIREIGSHFNVDSWCPANWPKQQYEKDNKLYQLDPGNEYTHKGEMLTVNSDYWIDPNYIEVTKGTVIFSMTDSGEDYNWGNSDHIYYNQLVADSIQKYSEVRTPTYPSVKEVYMAKRKGEILLPSVNDELEACEWKNDSVLGWYLNGSKVTGNEPVTLGTNLLTFKGNVKKKITVFCFAPGAKDELTSNGGTWNVETIDGTEYQGYISHTSDPNPTFPTEERYGMYKMRWSGHPIPYQVNFCTLEYCYDGFIIPKIAAEDSNCITAIMDKSNNLIDYDIIDYDCTSVHDALEHRGIHNKGVHVDNSDGRFILHINDYEDESRRFKLDPVVHDVGGKKYCAIGFGDYYYHPYEYTVSELKANAGSFYTTFPAYDSEMYFGYYQNTPYFEVRIRANGSSSPEQWSQGQIVDPKLVSSNPS